MAGKVIDNMSKWRMFIEIFVYKRRSKNVMNIAMLLIGKVKRNNPSKIQMQIDDILNRMYDLANLYDDAVDRLTDQLSKDKEDNNAK